MKPIINYRNLHNIPAGWLRLLLYSDNIKQKYAPKAITGLMFGHLHNSCSKFKEFVDQS